jgi:release factor glutamine methyltransferase
MLPAVTVQSETESWTIRRVLTWTQQRFAAQGLASPRLDAELLLAHSLGQSRVALYTHYEQPLEAKELERYRGLIKRRLGGEPVAYLVGQKEFYTLPQPLQVSDAVLIPRPETELLVEATLARLPAARTLAAEAPPAANGAADDEPPPAPAQVRAEPGVALTVEYEPQTLPSAEDQGGEAAGEPPEAAAGAAAAAVGAPAPAAVGHAGAPVATVADVGTGSGAVALSLKHSRPDVRVLAIDRCDAALQIAAHNAERLGLSVEFFHGDLLAPLPPPLRLDAIAANLPYIPSAEIARLAPEVRAEPHAALDGGPDGLGVIRRLVAQAPQHLRRGGALLLEIGAGQHTAVEALLRAAGFVDVHSQADLAHIPRVVVGSLPL